VLAPVLGRAAAKQVLSETSARSAASGLPLAEVLAGRPELAGRLTTAELDRLCDPAGYTGAAPALVDRALADRDPADRDPAGTADAPL
jgi:3-carboxy-cis,cis-muconate cycloisomerase